MRYKLIAVLGVWLASLSLSTISVPAGEEFRVINCRSAELRADPVCIEQILTILSQSARTAYMDATSRERDGFNSLGVSQDKLLYAADIDPASLLSVLRSRFNNFNNDLQRAAVFRMAFGSGFSNLAVVLKLNDEEFNKFVEQARSVWKGA